MLVDIMKTKKMICVCKKQSGKDWVQNRQGADISCTTVSAIQDEMV